MTSKNWAHDPSYDVWHYEPYEGSHILQSFKTLEEAQAFAEGLPGYYYSVSSLTITGGTWTVS